MNGVLKFGVLFGVVLGLSLVVGSGSSIPAIVLVITAVLCLVYGGIAWRRAALPWFAGALVLNAISSVLVVLLLLFRNDLGLLGLLCLGVGVLLGFLGTAWMMQRQQRLRPSRWSELKRRLEEASVVDLLLGRPLNEFRAPSR